jgi:hypothetical protein
MASASVAALAGLVSGTAAVKAATRAQRTSGAHDPPVSAASPPAWSSPSTLAECELANGPQVAFPSDSPSTATGAGAIVWASDPSRCGAPTPPLAHAPWGLSVATLGPTDRARLTSTQSLAGWSGLRSVAVGGNLGRVAVAVSPDGSGASAGGGTAVLQGRATSPLGPPMLLAGAQPPFALSRAYLGDVAIATVVAGPAIAVRLERYFRPGFARARLIPIHAGRVTALTAAMDYRADVLLVWQQSGAIYAHLLRASGRTDPTQRVAPSGPDPQLHALVSDNDHGMIAWSSSHDAKRSGARTRVYLDLSAAGVRFRAPQLLASFADPQQVGRSPGSLALVRLSSENVMLAWTAVEHGHYVVRGAPAVFAATRPTVRLSDPHAQAVLADLAAGPAREAVALWKSGPRLQGGRLDASQTELWVARASIGRHDRLRSRSPEMIAAAGPNIAPSVAVDPANDRAVAAWLTLGAHRRIEYSVSLSVAGHRRPLAAVPPPSSGTHWLRITLGAGGAAAAVMLLALATRRRRRRGRRGA